ncbi:4989_t:CDS:2 [Ambispora leptoticha]|uniref:4989_t:CDS:1 n=1 Tax=Ambispora leptoticha TaxID=144679 RepID=A0A9N9E1Q2_9GLOM|nr:4989_t:CDS:2 [Ambispora leptoticha]
MSQQHNNQETSAERNAHLERRHIRDRLRQERETSEEPVLDTTPTEQLPLNNIQELTQYDRQLLGEFRNYMAKLKNLHCFMCNKYFPTINLTGSECQRCYSDKEQIKKFSLKNNMDPGDVPTELQGLTDIEEMLIAQVFPVMSVYTLRGGQYGYRGNIINFPQDIAEFTTRLPHHPSSLEICVVRWQSEDGSTFRDFKVHRRKVAQALQWLKENNTYYSNITIENDVLQFLKKISIILEQIPQLNNNQPIDKIDPNNVNLSVIEQESDDYDVITSSFVPISSLSNCERHAIRNALSHMQDNQQNEDTTIK